MKMTMDIEEFNTDELKDELLKVVDEMYYRKYTFKEIVEHILNGERKQ